MHTQRIGGYTLIELLTALTIATVLTQLGIGGAQALTTRAQKQLTLQTTIATLDRARSLAVIRGKHIGVCMLASDKKCDANWSGSDLVVFVDANQNHQHDNDEDIIYREAWPSSKIQLQWSNWRHEPLITYKPDGAVTSNGTLTFFDDKNERVQAIVINKPGRARIQ
jgi:type IV fimbrial biogenesis protein FimT